MQNNVFLNDVDMWIKCTLSKFAVSTNLGRAVDSLKGRETLQRDLNRLCSRIITRCMKFNKEKCWLLQLERDNTYRLEDKRLKSSPAERYLGIWVNGKLNMSQLPGRPTTCVLGCIWMREGLVPLCSVLSTTIRAGQGTTALFSLEKRRQRTRRAAEWEMPFDQWKGRRDENEVASSRIQVGHMA